MVTFGGPSRSGPASATTVVPRQARQRSRGADTPGGRQHDGHDRPAGAADDDHVLDHLIIRFAGDSGDGMQLTGDRFTSVSASFGNDLSTLPDFPAEIRAPAGTVNGVSAFQVNIADHKITTPGDEPNVLVAMNPAALMADLHRLEPGGTVIVNEDAFEERNLDKAGYKANPLDDDTLANYRVLKVPMTSLTKEICAPLGVKPRDAERSKNFFALGLVSFMYTRPVDPTLDWIAEKFGGNELVEAANKAAFLAGFNFGETTEAVGHRYEVKPAKLPAGEYTSVTGNTALAWGIVAAGQLAKLPITLGSYPITPASDILHELSKHKHFGIRTVQAEDEIAAIGMALGAAFAGHLGVTTTSGPGVALKSETTSLAVSIELPAAARRHPARWARRPGCRPRPRPPTSTSPSTAATARHRCPSSPPTRRRSASMPRSRRSASPSSTAPR